MGKDRATRTLPSPNQAQGAREEGLWAAARCTCQQRLFPAEAGVWFQSSRVQWKKKSFCINTKPAIILHEEGGEGEGEGVATQQKRGGGGRGEQGRERKRWAYLLTSKSRQRPPTGPFASDRRWGDMRASTRLNPHQRDRTSFAGSSAVRAHNLHSASTSLPCAGTRRGWYSCGEDELFSPSSAGARVTREV